MAIISRSAGSLECVKALLNAGADATITDAQGRSPYSLAEEGGKYECMALLKAELEQPAPSSDTLRSF